MPFADGDGRKYVEETVEDLRGGLRGTLSESLAEAIGAGLGQEATRSPFRGSADGADGERSAEDAQVMVVDLVAERSVPRLVETFEPVEADGIAVRHEQPVEGYGEARLAKRFDLARFSENLATRRNEQVLAVAGIDIARHQTVDGSCIGSVEPVDEDGFEDGSLEHDVSFSCRHSCSASGCGGRGFDLFFVGFPRRGTRGGAGNGNG